MSRSPADQCGASMCMDDILDCRRDVYVECTLPTGHDGPHRVHHVDDWKRITVDFEHVDSNDD